MVTRVRGNDPEKIRGQLVDLLQNFSRELRSDDLRQKVKALIPAYHMLRHLGSSLIPLSDASSARGRILAYFRKYPRRIIDGDELLVVSGIGEWARRIRELRVQFGWSIVSGVTAQEMGKEGDDAGERLVVDGKDISSLKPEQYILLDETEDRDAAFRWNQANAIRRSALSVKEKILNYLRKNVGKPVSGEELRYVAKDRTEWARRVRELRTEEGWPVVTKSTGRPNLPVGMYVLERDRQAQPHDRKIPDPVRVAVLKRDTYTCQAAGCGWNHSLWNRSDPRFLELHHKEHHAKGGKNTPDNLITLCNICHDDIHRRESKRRG